MGSKYNPVLAAFEAKKEREFQGRLACNSEVGIMAALIAGNNLGFIANKRADLFLEEIIAVKMKIAESLLQDSKDDKTLEYTRADLARSVKKILGDEGWGRCKHMFPFLKDYWEV